MGRWRGRGRSIFSYGANTGNCCGTQRQSSMNHGDFLTRLCIWLALIAYVIGAGLMLQARERERWRARARGAWTVGCVFFLAHVVCAFAFFHHWSHEEAYRETTRQTAALT